MFEKNITPADHRPPKLSVYDLYEGIFEGDVVDGLYNNGQLVAFSWCIPKVKELYVNVIAVNPTFHNRGYARLLLEGAVEKAERLNLATLSLAVDPLNGPGISSYFHQGFRIVDFNPSYYGDSFPNSRRLVMQKNLQSPPKEYQFETSCLSSDYGLLAELINDGFEGTAIEMSPSYNNYENTLIFGK